MTTSRIPGFDPSALDPTVAARIPERITVNGESEIRGIEHADTLRFFASLPLNELRQRQAITSSQFAQAVAQPHRLGHEDFEAGIRQLQATESLLMDAVGLISFDDWIVASNTDCA